MNVLILILRWYPVLPTVLFIAFVIVSINTYKKVTKFSKTEGEIVGFYENSAEMYLESGDICTVSPIVSYKVNDSIFTFKGKYYSTSMKLGDKLTVLYDKNNPSKASISAGLYFAPIILGILLICSLVAFVTLYMISKQIQL